MNVAGAGAGIGKEYALLAAKEGARIVVNDLGGSRDGSGASAKVADVVVDETPYTPTKSMMLLQQINAAMQKAAAGPLKGVLFYCEEPLVSIDFNGNPHSSIFDSQLTKVMGGNLVKVLSWYDNEWGVSKRMGDVTRVIGAGL